MNDHLRWHVDAVMKHTAEALEKNQFQVHRVSTREGAAEFVLSLIKKGESVGYGGSQTLKDLKIIDKLAERGHPLIEQKPGMKPEEIIQARRDSLLADVFLASPNAVTKDGKLFFVDKIGNRAAGIMFGPKRVIVVAGRNKIVENEMAADARVRNIAGPANAHRLGLSTPCTVTGTCADCASPQRICNIAVTLRKRPAYTEFHVILVEETLGY